MAILTEASLNFAREHIDRYYDSDFFPKPVEFHALWHHWDEVVKELTSKNISKLWVTPPRAMTVPKPKGGFRVVHQLEPLDSLVYAALGYAIAPSIEAARMPVADGIACSYRFKVAGGSFFAGGAGWMDFQEKTEELAKIFSHVLVTDITDFYNQIYLHRLNNAIELSEPSLKPVGAEVENFLLMLNNKASQGIPVGPAASIIMAEAVMIDVDVFLRDAGVAHTRYVDDIRLFANSPRELNRVLEQLTLYLYENHRLTISSEKTTLFEVAEFARKHIHNQYLDEKSELLDSLDEYNPYSDDYDSGFDDFEDDDDEVEMDSELSNAILRILKFDYLDLGLARGVIRTARRNSASSIAKHLVENFEFFAPVVSDMVLYLHEVSDDALAKELLPQLEAVAASSAVDCQLVRFWFEWYVAQSPELMKSVSLQKLIFSGPNIENQALAAITTANIAWVRNQKAAVYNVGHRARRAIINAARVLPSDERTHYLRLFAANSPMVLDRWVAKWVMDTA